MGPTALIDFTWMLQEKMKRRKHVDAMLSRFGSLDFILQPWVEILLMCGVHLEFELRFMMFNKVSRIRMGDWQLAPQSQEGEFMPIFLSRKPFRTTPSPSWHMSRFLRIAQPGEKSLSGWIPPISPLMQITVSPTTGK
jgi:hypothetical protein